MRWFQTTNQVTFAGITVCLVRKPVKYLRISVRRPNGQVRICAPWHVPMRTIENLIQEKLAWIQEHQRRFREKPPLAPPEYQDGATLRFLGKPFTLHIKPSARRAAIIEFHEDTISVTTRDPHDMQKTRRVLEQRFREILGTKIVDLIAKWEPILGVKVDAWAVKRMKTRWGTCNIRARRIWINLELIRRRERCLEYIVVHEMVHLLERSHNHRFKSFMDHYLPDWRSINQELN